MYTTYVSGYFQAVLTTERLTETNARFRDFLNVRPLAAMGSRRLIGGRRTDWLIG